MSAVYEVIPASVVPRPVRDGRWDVPMKNQGQIVEVAYSDATPSRSEACHGSLYRRTIDRSDPHGTLPTYARRVA